LPYPYASDRDEILSRLRKVEGQIRGIQRMVSEDAYCVDVLTQISAVVSGIEKVGLRVLRDHMRGCVSDAVQSKDKAKSEDRIDEVIKVVERFLAT
jgi:CsoR family transcriptional regulator, copper-sensing transcriptional repressor